MFPDAEFKAFYVLDNGRKSVPPSQMVRMVLLQWFDKVSDDQAVERARFDLRWKVAGHSASIPKKNSKKNS